MNFIWLSSFQKNGTTCLSTILWDCFSWRSVSIYPDVLIRKRVLSGMFDQAESSASARKTVNLRSSSVGGTL